jgi:hypothetical protein
VHLVHRYHLEFLENQASQCFLFHLGFLPLLVFPYFQVTLQVQYFLSNRLDRYHQ